MNSKNMDYKAVRDALKDDNMNHNHFLYDQLVQPLSYLIGYFYANEVVMLPSRKELLDNSFHKEGMRDNCTNY